MKNPRGFKCECGKFNSFSAWVYAHWTIELTHACECGRKYMLMAGRAKIIGTENPTRRRK